jgi:hypothetical protein
MNGEIDIVTPVTEIYVPTKIWYAMVDDNNKLLRTVGSMFPVSNLKCSDAPELKVIELGQISQHAWTILNKIIHVPYYGGYIIPEEREIIYYRLKADVSNSYKTDGKYHTTDSKLTITAKCLDEQDGDVMDVRDSGNLRIKKLRLTEPPKQHSKLLLLSCLEDENDINAKEVEMTSNVQHIEIQAAGEYTLRLSYIHYDEQREYRFERYITIQYEPIS